MLVVCMCYKSNKFQNNIFIYSLNLEMPELPILNLQSLSRFFDLLEPRGGVTFMKCTFLFVFKFSGLQVGSRSGGELAKSWSRVNFVLDPLQPVL